MRDSFLDFYVFIVFFAILFIILGAELRVYFRRLREVFLWLRIGRLGERKRTSSFDVLTRGQKSRCLLTCSGTRCTRISSSSTLTGAGRLFNKEGICSGCCRKKCRQRSIFVLVAEGSVFTTESGGSVYTVTGDSSRQTSRVARRVPER